jgi:putative transposase
MTLELIAEAEAAGARTAVACEALGLRARTVERWRGGAREDLRQGPTTEPANKLATDEQQEVMKTMNQPKFRDLSPNQIVPLLADEGRYLASESTMYRLLRKADQLHHRERSRPRMHHAPVEHVATGPNQVWSWDITYLRSPVLGAFFYLYLVVDVWSRKIVAWEIHTTESPELASRLIERTCCDLKIDPFGLVLHSDNGGPMKGTTMVATLERLGILPSFSRPRVSNDNPFSEALFRTLKYCPEYPSRPFADLAAARSWVESFAAWYNTVHLHSGIRFVTPDDRHSGRETILLNHRNQVYACAQAVHPERWSRGTRCWQPIARVYLNPELRDVTRLPPGGLGNLVPSGAGQSPDKARQKLTGDTKPVAPPTQRPSPKTIAPIEAIRATNSIQPNARLDSRIRRTS